MGVEYRCGSEEADVEPARSSAVLDSRLAVAPDCRNMFVDLTTPGCVRVQLEELQIALPDRYRLQREIGRGGMAVVISPKTSRTAGTWPSRC
jgi:hypothetical protein